MDINFADPGDHKANLVPGSDGVGTIHTTGPSSAWATKKGTNVIVHCNTWITGGDVRALDFALVFGGINQDGTLQQWIVVDDERIVEAPLNLKPTEAATLVTAGTTAWVAIRESLDLRANGELDDWKGSWTQKRLQGKTVLTQGTGGVSCFAIQVRFCSQSKVVSSW